MNWKSAWKLVLSRVPSLVPSLVLITSLAAFTPSGEAAPWLCTNADGNKAFSYEPESAQNKHCVDHPISRGNVWRATPSAESSAQHMHENFPRVDAKSQKQRDAFRRRILERELAEEQKSLASAVGALAELKQTPVASDKNPIRANVKAYEDRIRVHQTNIGNLQKELGREG